MRLSENQKLILKIVADDLGDIPTSEIIRSLYQEANNAARAAVSRSLRNLEIKGLIRIRHADLMEQQLSEGRDRVFIRITDEGTNAFLNMEAKC